MQPIRQALTVPASLVGGFFGWLFCCIFGWLVCGLVAGCQSTATPDVPAAVEIGADGGGRLVQCGTQRLLILEGSPFEMGRQHGALMEGAAQTVTRETLAWCASKGLTRDALAQIFEQFEPFLPDHYKEEMRGLAEGSGMDLRDVQLLHAMPTKFHCSGAAAAGRMTRDGNLYHSRSLDYSLDIGVADRLQNHALLIFRNPSDGAARTVVPGWAGFLGSVTGMSDRGISVGEKGAASDDESFAGVPMIFTVREVLRRSQNLAEAIEVFRTGPRTCGFNFIVGSGRERQAVAVEVTRNHFFVSGFGKDGLGDRAEDVPPHKSIPDAVRRTNHFVGKETAKTQPRRRDAYHPRRYLEGSWLRYRTITEYLETHRGKLDAKTMVDLLRRYPKGHGCLHQAVMCPTDLTIWVSQAIDDRVSPTPGAQNQTFYGYTIDATPIGTMQK